jgi:protein JSN1
MGYNNQRNDNSDNGVQSFPPFNQGMMYNAPNGPMTAANLPQLQFQQNMMNRGPPPMNYTFPPMQAGFAGYNGPNPQMDQFRQQNMANGSPVQQPPSSQMPQMPAGQAPFAPPGFGMGMGGYGGYGNMGGMPNMGGYMQQQQQQQDQGNQRRGRVSHFPH